MARVDVAFDGGQVHGAQAQLCLFVGMLVVKGAPEGRRMFALLQRAVNAEEELLGGATRLTTIVSVLTGRR